MSNGKALRYSVRRAEIRPRLKGEWDGEDWQNVEELTVAHFLSSGSDHRPSTQAKLLYGGRLWGIGIYGAIALFALMLIGWRRQRTSLSEQLRRKK